MKKKFRNGENSHLGQQAVQSATSSRPRQKLTTEQYEATKRLAERLDKCAATTKNVSWYNAAFKRFYNLLKIVAERDNGLAGCVANTVGSKCGYGNGKVADCSLKQSWILAMWCVQNGVNL